LQSKIGDGTIHQSNNILTSFFFIGVRCWRCSYL